MSSAIKSGILRDVFTMGARPIANLNSIHFGSPNNKKTKSLLSGVVSGIGGYGNCIGVPTVGGETKFDSCYNRSSWNWVSPIFHWCSCPSCRNTCRRSNFDLGYDFETAPRSSSTNSREK